MPAEPVVLTLEGRAEPACLERVHELVAELWDLAPDVRSGDRLRFETAVIEVAGNIVEHAGPDVLVQLRLVAQPDRVEARFCDTGRAVDLAAAEQEVVDPMAEAGRGIALARAAVDVVAYERSAGTNHWSLVQRRTASSSSGSADRDRHAP